MKTFLSSQTAEPVNPGENLTEEDDRTTITSSTREITLLIR